MRSAAMCFVVGVLALGGQPSEAGTEDHARHRDQHSSSTPRLHRYVAVGDSYTSGSGIPPDSGSSCLRSQRNYPRRFARRADVRLVDVSCQGATTANGANPQSVGGYVNPPQLDAVDRRADLVTVSLGINDAGFYGLINQCLDLAPSDPQGAPCRASYQTPQGDALLSGLPAVSHDVERVLKSVEKQAPTAQVMLVSYPQLVPPQGTCAELPFAAADYAYVADFFTAVDAALRRAARRADVTFVDMLSASAGHDACAGARAWLKGAGSSVRTMAFHPFANEQRAVAGLVANSLE